MNTNEAIERNKRDGLLCACNKVRVPYDLPRTLTVSGITHGYDHCAPMCEKCSGNGCHQCEGD